MNIRTIIAWACVFAFIGCQGKRMNPKDFTSVNVVRNIPKSVPTPIDTLPVPVDTHSQPENIPAPSKLQDSIPKATAPAERAYHIIVASYPNQSPADNKVKQLKAKGFEEACVIHKDNRFRVSISHFPTRQAAINERTHLSKLLNQDDIWIGHY